MYTSTLSTLFILAQALLISSFIISRIPNNSPRAAGVYIPPGATGLGSHRVDCAAPYADWPGKCTTTQQPALCGALTFNFRFDKDEKHVVNRNDIKGILYDIELYMSLLPSTDSILMNISTYSGLPSQYHTTGSVLSNDGIHTNPGTGTELTISKVEGTALYGSPCVINATGQAIEQVYQEWGWGRNSWIDVIDASKTEVATAILEKPS